MNATDEVMGDAVALVTAFLDDDPDLAAEIAKASSDAALLATTVAAIARAAVRVLGTVTGMDPEELWSTVLVGIATEEAPWG